MNEWPSDRVGLAGDSQRGIRWGSIHNGRVCLDQHFEFGLSAVASAVRVDDSDDGAPIDTLIEQFRDSYLVRCHPLGCGGVMGRAMPQAFLPVEGAQRTSAYGYIEQL
ncbi:MAG: hypothetical protein ACYDHP_08345 [Ferrimicrobium sp.]